MKFIITLTLLLAICSIALSQNLMEEIKSAVTNCMTEHKIEPKTYEEFAAGNIAANDAQENLKCFSKCFLEKMSWIDIAAGDFKPDIYKSKLSKDTPMEAIEKVIAACKDVKGANTCDKAFQISTCIHKNKAQKI